MILGVSPLYGATPFCYLVFMFDGKLEDFENGPIQTTLKSGAIDIPAYNEKLGGAMFVAGAATLKLKGSIVSNGKNSTKITIGHFDHQYIIEEGVNFCSCFMALYKLATNSLLP